LRVALQSWRRIVLWQTWNVFGSPSRLASRFTFGFDRTRLNRKRLHRVALNLKTFGIVLSRRTGEPFERLVEEACGDNDGMLNRTVQSLLCVYSCLKEQIRHLDRQLMGCARTSTVCQQLMSIPGVGVLTALAFVTAVDDPTKFIKSRSVGAYFGLTPRCYQSAEIDQNRGISKCGDSLVRTYLFEATGTLLTRVEKWSALKTWGLRLAKRSGMKKAKIAVARKLAVIMHRPSGTARGRAPRRHRSRMTTPPRERERSRSNAARRPVAA
jgi:transposase